MGSAKALLGAVVGRLLFREAEVTEVRDVAPRLRLIDARGPALREVDWTPGDKVQVYLPDEGMRTYTPMTWDSERGSTRLLLYVHGEPARTPGAVWASGLRVGDRFRFFGPRGSIAFPDLGRHLVFVGDETSFAAAAALRDVNRSVKTVFEVDDDVASRDALAEIGLEGASLVRRRSGNAHVDELIARVSAELGTDPSCELTLTGKAQTIQELRRGLESRGLRRSGKVKAYWSVGKSGLD